jgi:hypothetical protein
MRMFSKFEDLEFKIWQYRDPGNISSAQEAFVHMVHILNLIY